MKISIITVCCNAEKTIENTLASVFLQDHPDIEYIVIDGASRDGTVAILERYRHRFAHLVSEPDKGIYDAMNKGIALATGDVIGLLNADDIYAHRGVLSKVAIVMQAENLDALYGDLDYFSGDNPDKITRHYSSARFRPELLAWGWMPAHPTLFLQHNIYKKYGLFKTDYHISADFEFVARIFYGNMLRYTYIPEVMVRMRAGGVSNRNWRNTWLLNREVMRACRENNITTNWLMILSKYPAKLCELCT